MGLLQCRLHARKHISAFHQEFQLFDYAYALWCGGQVFPSSARSEAVPSMAGRLGICLSCFAIVAASHADSLGAKGRLHGDDLAHSEYTLNLQPPEENAHDVEASLDAIMKAEDEKRILSDSEFAAAKQRLINLEKQRIQDIVREAFESV